MPRRTAKNAPPRSHGEPRFLAALRERLRHYDAIRSDEADGALEPWTAYVNEALPAGSSRRDLIETVARAVDPDFRVLDLPADLDETKAIRGRVLFKPAAILIDECLENYGGKLCRWLANDGLHVTEWTISPSSLGRFDRLAGKRMVELAKDGRWPIQVIKGIAAELDAEGFRLKEELTDTQWKRIAEHSQKAGKPIPTFLAAASSPMTVRSVRRRLYEAKDRYTQAEQRHHERG